MILAVGIGLGTYFAVKSTRAFHHGAAGAGLLLLDEAKPAAGHFERALALNDRPFSYSYFGVKAFQRAGRPELALDAVSALIERDPEDPRNYVRRAKVYANLIVGERMNAFAGQRPPDSEKIKLWEQLRLEDLTRAAERGSREVKEAEELPPEKIDYELYGKWRDPKTGDVHEFDFRTYTVTVPEGHQLILPYEIDKTTDPKRFTVNEPAMNNWKKYSYRVEGDVLLLATRGNFMDPPRSFEDPVSLDGRRGVYIGFRWKLQRVKD